MLNRIFKKRGGFLIFILMLFFTSVYAHEGQEFTQGGTAPGDFFYNFEEFFENTALTFATSPQAKAELEAKYATERFAEMHQLVDEGQYQVAQEAATKAHQLLRQADEHVNQIKVEQITDLNQIKQGQTQINNLIEVEKLMVENSVAASDLKELLATKVESGEISVDNAAQLIDDLRQEVVNVEALVLEKEENIVEDATKTTGKTKLEVELALDAQKQQEGLTQAYQEKLTQEEISALQVAVSDIEQDYKKAQEQGRLQQDAQISALLDQAKLKLQIAQDSYENKDYSKGFGQFTAAEHLAINVDRIIANPQEEGQNVIEKLQKYSATDTPPEITQDMIDESKRFVEDYEKTRQEISSKYPDKVELLEHNYEQSNRILSLSKKLEEAFSKEYETLTKEQGKTPAEADAVLRERFVEEYRAAYGKEFTPPGFATPGVSIEEIPIGEIPDRLGQTPKTTPHQYLSFVEDYIYIDPVSGYKYEFAKDGYKYTTPFGENYEKKYPEGYIQPEDTYKKGNEIYNYEYKTPQGTVKYEYSATGYTFTNPDGTTETHTYPQGEYKTTSGGQIEIKPTGFEIKSQEGQNIKWEYNPEFKNYVSPSVADVYVPPQGASSHVENTIYYADKKEYSYNYEGQTWNYNPSSDAWVSSTGETYKPQATTIAPSGYESHGSYTTEGGETWSYDSQSGSWKSSTGEAYTQSTSQYTASSGTSYYYDPSTSTYVDSSGKTYSSNYYDSSTSGSTVGASGTVYSSNYDPNTGTYQTTTYTYDSTSGTYSPGSTTASSGTSYSGTGGYTGGTTYSGDSYSGTTYSGTTSYSGGTYSGSYSGYSSGSTTSSGTYSGDSTSGGSYSGGDSGGTSSSSTSTSSSTSSGGGDSGGGGTPTGSFIYDVLSYRTFKSTQTTQDSDACCPCN